MKELRQQINKTQNEVAKELSMPRTKYARYETEESNPDIPTLKKLADYYHTTIDNIVDHNVPYLLDKSTLSQNQQRLIEKITKLPPNLCEQTIAYIDGMLIAEEEKQRIINLYKKGE